MVRVRRVTGADAHGAQSAVGPSSGAAAKSQLVQTLGDEREAASGRKGSPVTVPRTSQLPDLDPLPRQHSLRVILEDVPVHDPGTPFALSALSGMTKRELIGLLTRMHQVVIKKEPTRLELLGAVVTILCRLNRVTL